MFPTALEQQKQKKNKKICNLIQGKTAFSFHLVACHSNNQGKQQMKCQRVKREAGERDETHRE